MFFKKLVLTILLVATVFMGICQKKDLKSAIMGFENEVTELKDILHIPGLSFAIVKDQKLVYATGLGYADLENKIPATKNTLYSIASVTKTFTSLLLMQLVEKGKLDLNDPISKYDSSFKSDSLKVIHFLTHTSEGSPGGQYKYSGDRYAVLDKVLEKVTGVTVAANMTGSIINKAGMTQTVAGHDVMENDNRHKSLRPLFAKPYTLYGRNEMILSPYPPKKVTTSAGIVSNVTDLAKYDIAIDNHLLLPASAQNKTWTPYVLNSGSNSPYGLGWFTTSYKGKKILWHTGLWPTHSALYLKVPEENITLIILGNSDGVSRPFSLSSGNIANSAFALSFFRHFIINDERGKNVCWTSDTLTFKQSVTDRKITMNDPEMREHLQSVSMIDRYLKNREARVRKEVKVDPKILQNYTGTFELLPLPLKFSGQNDKLMVTGPSIAEPVQMFAESENKFFLKILNAQVEFLRNKEGFVDECMLYLDGNKYRCKKLY